MGKCLITKKLAMFMLRAMLGIAVIGITVPGAPTREMDLKVCAANPTIIAEGQSNKVAWSVDENGLLTITGTGDISYSYEDKLGYDRAPWLQYKDQITKAVVALDDVTVLEFFFYECTNLKTVDLSKLDTSRVQNMSHMFYHCSSLEELDVTGFSTSKVRYMDDMFYGCESLKTLDVSGFDTARVVDMSGMFCNCSGVENLDVTHFDTIKVESFEHMFYGCKALKTIDFGEHFDTASAKTMSSMFRECEALEKLDLSSFNTANVENMGYMFANCSSLKYVDLSSFDTSSNKHLRWFFLKCSSLEKADLSHFDTTNVEEMDSLFDKCSNLVEIDISSFDMTLACSKMYSIDYMIRECNKLMVLKTPKAMPTTRYQNFPDVFVDDEGNEYTSMNSDNVGKRLTRKHEHVLEHHEKKPATCTLQGTKEYWNCSQCRRNFADQAMTSEISADIDKWVVIPALGHAIEKHLGKAATCTVAGYKTYYSCDNCKKNYMDDKLTREITGDLQTWRVIPAKGHVEVVIPLKPATMEADGVSAGKKCSTCGTILSGCQAIKKISSVTLSATTYSYDGKAKKPAVTVKNSGGVSLANTAYTVIYPSGRKKVGQYVVKIVFKGSYRGNKNLAFTIIPKTTVLKSVTAASKGFTVKWEKRTKQVDGYSIQYATNDKFTKNVKNLSISKNTTVSKKIKNLKAKKYYYVRVRTYKKVGTKKYYSQWSKPEKVKTK